MSCLQFLLFVCGCFCLVGQAVAAEDDLSDFTNNLAQDLGPLLALFGEAVTKQYLSESTTFLDYFTFAMGPLGIITAVVSVIRVCGHPSLRAFIGRSQEGEAAVEAELCASTSRDVCELFHKGGIARVLGRPPDLLELVCISDSNRRKKLKIFRDYLTATDDAGHWKRSRGSIFSPDNKASRYQLSETPNLSLNIGIKRPPLWVGFLVSITGFVLQAGVIVLAGVGAWRLEWNRYNPDRESSRDYAPRMFIAGSILLCLGMWGCATLIGQAMQEVRFKREKQAPGQQTRLIWLQPGPQLVGEQSFDPSAFFENEKQPLEYWISSRKRKGQEKLFEALTCLAVLASVVGYVLQFIGLRGMKAWLSLAQLGVTLFMSMLRGAVRVQRLKNDDNKLAEIPDLVAGHELDWLAYELAFGDSPMQSIRQPQRGANWQVAGGTIPQGNKPVFIQTSSSFGTSDFSKSTRINTYDDQSLRDFITSQGCGDLYSNLFDIRVQLSELTGNSWLPYQPHGSYGDKSWNNNMVAVRKSAFNLAQAFSEVANTLLKAGNRAQKNNFAIPVESIAHTKSGSFVSSSLPQIVGVEMKAPEPAKPTWRANPAHIEAILGLWVWSLISSQDFVGDGEAADKSPDARVKMENVSYQILAAGLDNENWQRDVDIEVELNFWFGPDTHHLSKEVLRLEKGMRCNNFSTMCRQLTGAGGWDKLPQSSELSSTLLSMSKIPMFHLRLFGWGLLCEALDIDETDPIEKSELLELSSHPGTSHVFFGVQYLRSQRSIIDLCTQQLFITLVKSLISLAGLQLPESIVSEKEGFIQLQNPVVETFEKAFVVNGIGSRTDAITTIIPQLRKQLLPSEANILSSLIHSANTFRQKGEWERAAVLLKWGCLHFCPQHANDQHTGLAQRWQLFERVLRATAEFYRFSAALKIDRPGISYARDGLRVLQEICAFISPGSSTAGSYEECERNIISLLACYDEVFGKLASKSTNTRKANTHPLVHAIEDGNRVDALYQLSLLNTGDFGSKPLKPALPLATRNQWTEIVDALLEMKASPDCEDECGRTGVSYCAELGYVSLLQELADHGAFLDQSDNMSRTPLHWAALRGQGDIIKLLIKRGGVDLSRQDQSGIVPLWHAIYENHPDIVQAVLDQGFNADAKCAKFSRSPLSWAAEHGQAGIVHHLIQNGAKIDAKETVYDLSPLHYACDNSHDNVVRVLLDAGADPKLVDQNGRTALHRVAKAGSAPITQLLINMKVDINALCNNGRTPLHYAADYGHDAVVDLLLSCGAEVEPRDRSGSTPIHMAAQNRTENKTQSYIINALLEHGASVDCRDNSLDTPLYLAAEHLQPGLIEHLIRHGANPNIVNKFSSTPLQRAAERDYATVVWKLVENGASLEIQDNEGCTALGIAADRGSMAAVKALVQLGAEVETENFKGMTPAMIAKKSGFPDIERYLNSSRGAA